MMVFAGRSDIDVLAVVLGRVRRALGDSAASDDVSLRAAAAFLTRSGPAWVQRADDTVRLDVLTAIEVLRHRRT